MIAAKRLTRQDANVYKLTRKALNAKSNTAFIRLRLSDGIRITRSVDIAYLQAMGNYTNIVLKNGIKVCYSQSLKQTLARIDQQLFIRLHQSYAVNKSIVESIEYKSGRPHCILLNGISLPISRAKKRNVTSWFLQQSNKAVLLELNPSINNLNNSK